MRIHRPVVIERGIFKFFAIAFALVIALTVGGVPVVEADDDDVVNLNRLLRGDYAFTQARLCVQTPAFQSFGPEPTQLPPGGATTRTSVDTGVITFNGDGTGSIALTALTINPDDTGPGAFPVTQSEGSADLDYTVKPDGSVTLDVTNFAFTIVVGNPVAVGSTGTLSDRQSEGQIGALGQVILRGDANPDVEILTLVLPFITLTFERICGRDTTLAKLIRITDDD